MRLNGSFKLLYAVFYRTLKGTVTLANFTTKIVSLNLQLSLPVEKALFKQFRKIAQSTHLGLVSRILEKDTFLVIEGSNQIVTRMDLLAFISNEAKNGIANGIEKGEKL